MWHFDTDHIIEKDKKMRDERKTIVKNENCSMQLPFELTF